MASSVVITGASTGIGAACAAHLAGRGFNVFAGVRKAADAERLAAQIPGVHPLFIDVTQPEVIAQAVQEVAQVAGSLHGLVNNAGVAYPGPLEFAPLEDVRRHMEINVIGQVAVTQAFLPLLRPARGRVVHMSSMGGVNSIPYFGAYCASKFALEGLNDALRLELRPFGMHVSIIEPGAVRTPIWAKAEGDADAMFADYPPEAWAYYGRTLRWLQKTIPQMGGMPPERVARAVEHALTARRPRARYVIDWPSRLRAWLEILPVPLRDWAIARAMQR
ncbi:MAG: SDR family oxidoreductase [Anaerolineales bacterium]